jgi:hypothetical protein
MRTRGSDITVAAGLAVLAAYLGLYFASAKFVNVGDSVDHYIVSYRCGPFSLSRGWWFFEPARWIDESVVRRSYRDRTSFMRKPDGTVVDFPP